jgi:transcriptional regulator with XRE-family HTH domain
MRIPAENARRVPGLRREEVASHAGISADYLRRVEQGSVLPSDAVLDSLAQVYGLDATEREHLQALANGARGREPPVSDERVERNSLKRILEALMPAPAVILGRSCDVLAWNAAGAALDPVVAEHPPGQRNVARRILLDPTARDLYPEWESLAREVANVLRLNAARFPDDEPLKGLIDELFERSEEFQKCWQLNEVREKTFGRKVLNHPLVGRLELEYEALTLPGTVGQQLLVYTADPASPSAVRLQELALRAEASPFHA